MNFAELALASDTPCSPTWGAADLIACAHSARPLEDCHIGMLSNFVSHVCCWLLSAFAVVALGLKVFGKL